MPETQQTGDASTQIPFAVSLLDDWSSFRTRLGAARFLSENLGFEDKAIGRIWECIYTEKRPEIIAELVETLGKLGERAADSVPLIAYHLKSEHDQVVQAATRALCLLSSTAEHALAPLLTAVLRGNARFIREAFLNEAVNQADPRIIRYAKELEWIKDSPRQERAAWLKNLPPIGISKLPEDDRARFLLLYADPTGEHVWGCLKVIWECQKAAPHAKTQESERALSACEGSFFREVTSYGEPIRARFLAKTLAQSRPFTASLAYPLAHVELDGTEAQAIALRIKATAAQLAPQTPPPSSLQSVMKGLWYEHEHTLRASAIDCLIDLLPDLGEMSAREVIDDVFEFLRHPVSEGKEQSRTMREVSSIVTAASTRDVEYILQKTEAILADSLPAMAKRCALRNLIHLRYAGEDTPLALHAKSILQRETLSDEHAVAKMARVALKQLAMRERHLASLKASTPSDG